MLSDTAEILPVETRSPESDIALVPGIRYRLDTEHCIVETRSGRLPLLPARYVRFEACTGQLRLPGDDVLGGFHVGIGPGTTAHLETVGMSRRVGDSVDLTAALTADGFATRHVELSMRLVELTEGRVILHALGWIVAPPAPVRARRTDPVTRLMTSPGARLEIAARFIR